MARLHSWYMGTPALSTANAACSAHCVVSYIF